jgi:hypothetical protein
MLRKAVDRIELDLRVGNRVSDHLFSMQAQMMGIVTMGVVEPYAA